MTPEHDQALRAAFPLVFAGPLLNDEPIRCGDGWVGLLHLLFAKLEKLIAAEPEDSRRKYRAVQVKEKFATLRVYQDANGTEAMNAAIRGAEALSAVTCDVCGREGQLVTLPLGSVATRCEAHGPRQ